MNDCVTLMVGMLLGALLLQRSQSLKITRAEIIPRPRGDLSALYEIFYHFTYMYISYHEIICLA